MADFPLIDEAVYEAATKRGEEERAKSAIPEAVHFDKDSGRIVVEFTNGSAFMVPARNLQGLQEATDEELSEVELLGETGLHWETLDVDYRIAALMAGTFGNAQFMEAGRRGGEARSEAKAAAARENGRKGGRPPKKLSPEALAAIGKMRKGRIIAAETELPRDENGQLILSKKEGVRIPRAVKERIMKMAREKAEAAAEEAAARQKKAG